jgi:HD-GYP domain-containing protein (c-di-GMP phosphodiesterase class II)
LTLESRTDRLERIAIMHQDVLDRHDARIAMHQDRIALLERLAEEQVGLNRDLVRLIGSIDDRLSHIEQILRQRGSNGQQP